MRKVRILLFFFLILSSSVFAQTQGPTSNVISMPWDAFMQLWANAKNDEQGQPKAAYGRFLYLGEVDTSSPEYLVHMTAKVDITTSSVEESLVPILPNKMTLESLTINKKDTPWSLKDGYYCAYLGGLSKHEVEATFTLKPEINGTTKKLRIPYLGQARQEIVLFSPEKDIQSYVDYGVALETIETDDGTQMHAYFKAHDNVSIIWYAKTENQVVAKSAVPGVSYFLKVADDGVESAIKLHLDIIEGFVQETELMVPENLMIDEIESGSIKFKKSYVDSGTKGYKLLRLKADQELNGSQDIIIRGVYYQVNASYIFSGLMPYSPLAEKKTGRMILLESEDKSYSVIRAKDLTEETINTALDNPISDSKIAHIFDVSGPDPQLDLNVKNETAFLNNALRITSVEVQTKINDSNILGNSLVVKIDNKKAQYLPLVLPKKATLNGLKVNQKIVNAINEGEGKYLVPVSVGLNEVWISYELHQKPNWLGHLSLSLASFSFPAENIIWHLGVENGGQLFVLSKTGEKTISDRTNLNNDKTAVNWQSFFLKEDKGPSHLSVLFLNRQAAQNCVTLLSIILGLYLFWALTFFFERAYLPDAFYETRTFALGTVLVLLMVALLTRFDFKQLGPFTGIIALSFFSFSCWQNRLVAKRFKVLFQNSYALIPATIFLTYLLVMIVLLLMGKITYLILPSFVLMMTHWLFLKTYPKLVDKRARTKILPHLILVLSLLLSGAVYADEIDMKPSGELKEGHVYMEWNIIEDLLKKIEKKELEKQKTAGLKYIFGTSKVSGDISGSIAQVRIETPVQIMTDKWIQVPVVSKDQVVTEVSLDGSMIPLRRDNDLVFFQGSRSKSGISKLEVEILLPIEKRGKSYSFKTNSELFKGANVSLMLEDDLKDATIEHIVWQKKEEGMIQAALDSSGILEIKVSPATEPETASTPDTSQESDISASHQIIALIEAESLSLKVRTDINTGKNVLPEAKLILPAEVKIIKMEGEGLLSWREESASEGLIVYNLQFKEGAQDKISLDTQLLKSIPGDLAVIEIPKFKLANLADQSGTLSVAMMTLSDSKIYSIKGLRTADFKRDSLDLPPLANVMKSFSFPDPDYELKISRGAPQKGFVGRPSLDILRASVNLDETSKVNATVSFKVVLEEPLALEVGVPQGARLNKILQNGVVTETTLQNKGVLETKMAVGINEVELQYTDVSQALPFGLKKIILPSLSFRYEDLELQLLIKKGVAIIPLWHSFGTSFQDSLKLLGVDSQVSPKSFRLITLLAGSTGQMQQRSFVFFQWPLYLAVIFYMVFIISIGGLVYAIVSLVAKNKIRAGVLILVLLCIYIWGPFPWYLYLISISIGLLIRFLRDFFKNDSSLVV